jgi:hypothetical protein
VTTRRAFLFAVLILSLCRCSSTVGLNAFDRSHLSPEKRWSALLDLAPGQYKDDLLKSGEEGLSLIRAERLVYSEPVWQKQAVENLVLSSEVGAQLNRFGLQQDLSLIRLMPLGLSEFERFGEQMLSELSVELQPVGVIKLFNMLDSHMEGGDLYINVNFNNAQAAMSFVYEYANYKLVQLPFSNLLATAGFGAVFDELPCARGESSAIPVGPCREQIEQFCREWVAHLMLSEFYLQLNKEGFIDDFGRRLVELRQQQILGRAIAKMHGMKIEYIYPLLKRTDGITVIFE